MSISFIAKLSSIVSVMLVLGGSAYAAPSEEIQAQLSSSTQSKATGTVDFMPLKGNKIEIVGDITGLTPGEHGMHVHAVGDCSDVSGGFKKSGGHFNPDSTNHGALQSGHAGDLGNIVADAKGEARFKIETNKFNLIENDKHSILGRALVVHAGQDDEKTNPAGNSGERILCGVIKNKITSTSLLK